jgi:hypothetical protein
MNVGWVGEDGDVVHPLNASERTCGMQGAA